MDELTQLYRRLAINAHPDKGPESERPIRTIVMQQINLAYKKKDIETLRRLSQTVSPPPPAKQRLTMPGLPLPALPLDDTFVTKTYPGTRPGIQTEMQRPEVHVFIHGPVDHLRRMDDLELANTEDFLEYATQVAGALFYIRKDTSIKECLKWYRRMLEDWEEEMGGTYSPSLY